MFAARENTAPQIGASSDTANKMEHKDLVTRENTLQVNFTIIPSENIAVRNSQLFSVMGGAVVFQARVINASIIQPQGTFGTVSNQRIAMSNFILVRFFKQQRLNENDQNIYEINLTCSEFSITDKRFRSDDGTWHLIHEITNTNVQQCSFLIHLTVSIAHTANFATLYDDDELLDFELRGEGGVVRFHKAVLAASSPVLRRMLSGPWKEASEGHVDLAGTSKSTLQNFKNYLYLGTLPMTGLEQMLLVASYYLMPELEQKCVAKLVQGLTAQSACYFLEFATRNKLTEFLIAILDAVQKGEVKVKDIKKHALSSNSTANHEFVFGKDWD